MNTKKQSPELEEIALLSSPKSAFDSKLYLSYFMGKQVVLLNKDSEGNDQATVGNLASYDIQSLFLKTGKADTLIHFSEQNPANIYLVKK